MDGSCYSDDGTDDIQISSSSNEAPANPAGIVPLLPQSSKPQANQRVRSKRPEPPGEFLMRRLDVNVQLACKIKKKNLTFKSYFLIRWITDVHVVKTKTKTKSYLEKKFSAVFVL